MDGYPLTPNGKVDRRALQASGIAHSRGETTFVAGRDEVELQLAEIWQNVLGVKVGVHDDFFDAGGHSLSAVRLFALIEKSFGRKLPLSTLYKAPTIERLADLLRETKPSNSWVSLVRIQVKGSAPPLFCIHGHFGDVLFCRRLSHHLGEGRPFFALQARGVTGLPAHDSIEGMASDYLREVRSVQPHGPYLLSGYCFGARVALEMAHQLRGQGEEVAFLGFLIDYDSEVDFTGVQKSRIRSHLAQLQQMGIRLKLFNVRTNLVAKIRSLRWRMMFRLVGRRLPEASPLLRDVSEMHLRAVRNYVPKYYPGRITVFAGGPVSADIPVNPQLNLYGMQAHQTDVHVVPRARNTAMIDEPFVQILAQQLNTCLSRAHESPGVQLGA
jgi:thioesterase domain-containing protein/acyl carrier protein